MKLNLKYLVILGLILFAFILSSINLQEVLKIISNASPYWVLGGVIFVVLEIVFKTLRWQVLLKNFSENYSFKQGIKNYLIGAAFGNVTPGKVGDFIKLFDLSKNAKLDKKTSFSVVLIDRIVDLFVVFVFGLISILVLVFLFQQNLEIMSYLVGLIIIVLILFILFVLAVTSRKSFLYRLLELFNNLIPSKRIKLKTSGLLEKINSTFTSIKINSRFVLFLVFTVIAWLFVFLTPFFFSMALGLQVEWLLFLIIFPIIVIVEILPISLLGLGTRDAAMLVLFGFLMVKPEAIIALSLMILLFSHIPRTIVGFIVFWKSNISFGEKK
ncbi:MAG: lysylphosphatidylglycerol synthase transmembrane domain-containing protein [archaeon]